MLYMYILVHVHVRDYVYGFLACITILSIGLFVAHTFVH